MARCPGPAAGIIAEARERVHSRLGALSSVITQALHAAFALLSRLSEVGQGMAAVLQGLWGCSAQIVCIVDMTHCGPGWQWVASPARSGCCRFHWRGGLQTSSCQE